MNNPRDQRNKAREVVCLCNNVSRADIEAAIIKGCDTLNKIFDATTAGVGPCGGSCRRKLQPMLDSYKANGTFPENLKGAGKGKCR